jgi:hypothetical protein
LEREAYIDGNDIVVGGKDRLIVVYPESRGVGTVQEQRRTVDRSGEVVAEGKAESLLSNLGVVAYIHRQVWDKA